MENQYKQSSKESGRFNLSVNSIFKEAWQNVYGIKGPIFMAEIYLIFIAFLFFFLASLIGLFLISVLPDLKPILHLITAFVSGGLLICGIAYLNRLSIKKISGFAIELTFRSFFRSYAYLSEAVGLYFLNVICLIILLGLFFLSLLFAGILLDGTAAIASNFSAGSWVMLDTHHVVVRNFVLVLLALELFVAFCIYSFFSTVFQMAIPVAMNQKIRVFLALKLIFISFSRVFFQIIVINILAFVLIFISAIPLGIGLIWTLPLAYNLNASIYKQVLGLATQK